MRLAREGLATAGAARLCSALVEGESCPSLVLTFHRADIHVRVLATEHHLPGAEPAAPGLRAPPVGNRPEMGVGCLLVAFCPVYGRVSV